MTAASLGEDFLEGGWAFCQSAAGQYADVDALEHQGALEWLPTKVPSTVAKSLHALQRYELDAPPSLHTSDFWYFRQVSGLGAYVLRFDGLATVAEVYLDGRLVATSESMYVPVRVPVQLTGTHRLHLVFRSLSAYVHTLKPRRARWRVAMVADQSLRAVRTTLLGHIPSWCPQVHAVGPWQPIALLSAGTVDDVRMRATVDGCDGEVCLTLRCSLDMAGSVVSCGNTSGTLLPTEVVGQYRAHLRLKDVSRWWPHGMGEQVLYEVALQARGSTQLLGRVGFRTVEVDRGSDTKGFALRVNGVAFFARGAVFAPVDLLHPGSTEGLAERLQLLVDMGANLIRVAGAFCYESHNLYTLCDALGLLVWQDLMLANFDYPLEDPAFLRQLEAEVEALLAHAAPSPSLVVLCGGSEVHQQAAMLGLPAARRQLTFFERDLHALVARVAPGLVVVSNSPSGGDLPFSVREGVSHYFGVGAYERPLDDARRASPRFVTECLAFSNIPEPITLDTLGVAAVHHPKWKQGVPRDRNASWDFEDTRDHYLERVFGLDPAQLRRTDVAHYLAASRALVAYIIATTLSEWRRPASPTKGALVFTAGDLQAGAGWGLIDAHGEPKSAYYGFRQAAQPVALLLTDEGCDGVDIHLVNDSPHSRRYRLEVSALQNGSVVVARGEAPLTVQAHGGHTVSATQVLGAFMDLSYAYRFGASGHDTVVVRAHMLDNDPASSNYAALQACYFPHGPYAPRSHVGVRAQAVLQGGTWCLQLETDRVARFVHIDDRRFRADDNYFHLIPGAPRCVRLLPRVASSQECPQGVVTAINATDSVQYQGVN
jgi:beta-mannosidase